MRIYYRLSDKSYPKTKLIGSSKEICLKNFCQAFAEVIFGKDPPPPEDFIPPVRIICDNCERRTVKMIAETGIPYTLTELGNAGSLKHALELAIKEAEDDELVYFCEDDYLHLPNACILLQEGIKRSEYVTLYDHPDKYTRVYNGGEFSKVIRTPSSHWRYTASTCMTFGTKAKTLKADLETWHKYTSETHPHDHRIFTDLLKNGRRLAVCIPGAACHVDLTFSSAIGEMLIEPWAIEMMIQELEQQIEQSVREWCEQQGVPELPPSFRGFLIATQSKQGKEKLLALEALRYHLTKKGEPDSGSPYDSPTTA